MRVGQLAFVVGAAPVMACSAEQLSSSSTSGRAWNHGHWVTLFEGTEGVTLVESGTTGRPPIAFDFGNPLVNKNADEEELFSFSAEFPF